MIRVINPVGKLVYVDQIQPVCEEQVLFNGRRIAMMERARDWSVKPTAIAMRITGVGLPCESEELLIGNLEPEKVLEIIRILGEKEYYDFSLLPYQHAEKYDQVGLDNGESAPYNNCTWKWEIITHFCGDDSWGGLEFPLGEPEEYKIVESREAVCNKRGLPGGDGLDWDSMNYV